MVRPFPRMAYIVSNSKEKPFSCKCLYGRRNRKERSERVPLAAARQLLPASAVLWFRKVFPPLLCRCSRYPEFPGFMLHPIQNNGMNCGNLPFYHTYIVAPVCIFISKDEPRNKQKALTLRTLLRCVLFLPPDKKAVLEWQARKPRKSRRTVCPSQKQDKGLSKWLAKCSPTRGWKPLR